MRGRVPVEHGLVFITQHQPDPVTVPLNTMGSKDQSSKGRSRRRLRDRQHQASHDQATDPGDIPELPMVPRGTPDPITDAGQLSDVIEHIRSAGLFAYDTEFIGEETYFPRLCLIQLSTAEQIFLVDPLSIEDLDGIWELIADPDVQTLVHAGQQDLEPVYRLMGNRARNVVDTQIAAGFAGLPYPCSLNRLILAKCDAVLGKGMTFTHWDRRPLSAMQRRYAADDVRYLPLAWSRMKEELEALGHLEWMHEECERLCEPDAFKTDYSAQVNRLQRNRVMKPAQRAMLHRLIRARDEAARNADVPPRSLIADEIIMSLLKKKPATSETLADLPGMPKHVARHHGEALLDAIQSDYMPELPPPKPRLADETVQQRVMIDSLWSIISSTALASGLAPPLLGSRAPFAQWCMDHEQESPLPLPELPGWRGEFLRTRLSEFMAGERTLQLGWHNGRLTLPGDTRPQD